MSTAVKKDKPKAEGGKSYNFKKKDSPHHGVEETLKKAAEEEADRQRQAAAAAEEARLAAQREEEQRLKKQTSLSLLNDEEKQKDLTAWVRSVPLSDSCIERLDRAFSDGSLLAEVIHHFCPSICDKRQYFKWNSKINKISNWNALNNKVFPKLGFRLNQKQINNLLSPYSCGKFQKDCEKGLFIYKLLSRVRKELEKKNSSVMEYRKSNFVPPSCEKKLAPRKLVNFLEHPPFSKVEMLIENGFYDEKKENVSPSGSKKCDCCTKSNDSFQTFTPCNFPTNGCIRAIENSSSCNEICIRPSVSIKWAQPAFSCFFWQEFDEGYDNNDNGS